MISPLSRQSIRRSRRRYGLIAALALAGTALAAEPDCKTFFVGTWTGEHVEEGILEIHQTITFEQDGKFSAQRTESRGPNYASDDMPVGTWQAQPGASEDTCQIAFTNGYSGEVTSEWAKILGPDTYGAGHDSTALVMKRQKP